MEKPFLLPPTPQTTHTHTQATSTRKGAPQHGKKITFFLQLFLEENMLHQTASNSMKMVLHKRALEPNGFQINMYEI